MKLFWKIIMTILIVIVLSLIGIVIAFNVSVKPGVYVIKNMFNQPTVILDEEKYEELEPSVTTLTDITYESIYENNELDIYYPAKADQPVPILFWVHGGGFVAGHKEDIGEFATYIAASNEVAVVAIDYETAPESQYPGQVKQLDEAYQFLRENKTEYPMLDFAHVLFGGDSAGAQIAGQYVAIQTNDEYATEMKMNQSVVEDSIEAFISYSGPVDLQQMKEAKSDSLFMKFFVNTVSRAFIGKRDWKHSDEINQASVTSYITENFPPTYITDGNVFSFSEQGLALVEKLKSLEVPVSYLFFEDSKKEIPHEYQFNYEMKEAQQSLQETIEFINTYVKEK